MAFAICHAHASFFDAAPGGCAGLCVQIKVGDWVAALNQPCRDFGLAPAAFDVQVRCAVRVRFQADRPGRQGRSVSYAKTAAGAGQPDAPGGGRLPGETGIGLLYHAFPPFCGIKTGRSKLNILVLALLRPSGGSLAPVAQSVKPFAARRRLSLQSARRAGLFPCPGRP